MHCRPCQPLVPRYPHRLYPESGPAFLPLRLNPGAQRSQRAGVSVPGQLVSQNTLTITLFKERQALSVHKGVSWLVQAPCVQCFRFLRPLFLPRTLVQDGSRELRAPESRGRQYKGASLPLTAPTVCPHWFRVQSGRSDLSVLL